MEFFTIGVYNSTKESFFDTLVSNNIDTFCDIRQRRGVRGAKYSYVNSIRLQEELDRLQIKYTHLLSLAPTAEIRNTQKKADDVNNELKRSRENLGQSFITQYENLILSKFDFQQFLETLTDNGAKRIAFFCVEENHQACHRSLVTNKLKDLFDYKVTHL